MPAAEMSLARPRLVATDLDGTFLRSDGSVSDRSARVWNALPGTGIETVIVTARPPRWLHNLTHVVGPRGVALCGNGAFVYEVATRRILDSHAFDPGVLREVVHDLRAAIPGVTFAAECADGPFIEDGFPDPHRDVGASSCRRGDTDAVTEGAVGKLLAMAPGIPDEELLTRVCEVLGERGHLAFSGARGLAEISPLGVTKAAALADWCLRLGIAADSVWAFGGMPNDLPMLGWAGLGWAVANGHPDVIAAADRTAPANDDDGVAVTLEPLLRAH